MRRARLILACALAVPAAAGAGCGSAKAPADADGAATSTPAAVLRSRLQAALQSQPYLSGAAALAGARNGFGSPSHAQAMTQLAAQTADLEQAVASASTASAAVLVGRRSTDLNLALDAYAKARKRGGRIGSALNAVGHARAQEAAALAAAGKGMSTQQVDLLLQPATAQERHAIDQLVANTTGATAALAQAATTAGTLAPPLSVAFARDGVRRVTGSPIGTAAALRALLTGQLSDQAHLVGAVSREIAGQGAGSPGAQAARTTLREGASLLEETIGAAWGQEARVEFASIWRRHLGALENYAIAKGRKDDTSARAALSQLTAFHDNLVAFFVAQDDKLARKSLQGIVGSYLAQATATTRAWVTGSPDAYTRYQHTADRMPLLAAVLARGIAEQFPDRFGA